MGVNDFIQIGTRIKTVRKEKGLAQKEVAKRLGIPVTTYSSYENNHREPNAEILRKIATVLDVSITDLMVSIPENVTVNWYLEKIMGILGYRIYVDDPEHPRYIIYNGETYKVSLQDLNKLYNNVVAFLKFGVEDLLKHNTDNDE